MCPPEDDAVTESLLPLSIHVDSNDHILEEFQVCIFMLFEVALDGFDEA
jgi:hypothetical protein